MQWLAPMTAIIAAAATVVPLVLLYFLKLRRQEQPISSTLLWRRAVQDLQVNAPFQRLRRNLLLLLQLLALAAVLAALGRPVLSLTTGPARRVVLLIDRSASMNAVDADGRSRLDEAKARAEVLIDSLRGPGAFSLRSGADEAMVVAFDSSAKVMCNFTSDRRQLLAAVQAIAPGDGRSSLAEALTVARAFAQGGPGNEAANQSQPAASLELLSDGRIGDAAALSVSEGELTFHRIGGDGPAENIAVVAMQARRSYEQAEQVEVFATLANFSRAAQSVLVQLSVDDVVRAVRPLDVPAARDATAAEAAQPGRASISFSLTIPLASLVEVRQLTADALTCDDAAWTVIPPPGTLRVLLVTDGNPALRPALEALELGRLDVLAPQAWAESVEDGRVVRDAAGYDVIVLDRIPAGVAPAELPPGRYLCFGRPPKALLGAGDVADEPLADQFILDWRDQHPVLQYVSLGNLFAASCWKLDLPPGADVLAEFADGPAVAMLRGGPSSRTAALLVPFDALETNWPFEPGFVMFCANAVQYLASEAAGNTLPQRTLQVGQPIVLTDLPPGGKARLTGPGNTTRRATADETGTLRLAGIDRAGVYRVTAEGASLPEGRAVFAVNLLDEAESDIAPADALALSGRGVQGQSGPPAEANVELWPYLALAALILACVEWFVYNSKLRL